MRFGVGLAGGALVALASLVFSPGAVALLAIVFVAGALGLCLQHSRFVLALVLAVCAVLLSLVLAGSAALDRGASPLASAGPGLVSFAPVGPAVPPHRLVSLPEVSGVPRPSIRVMFKNYSFAMSGSPTRKRLLHAGPSGQVPQGDSLIVPSDSTRLIDAAQFADRLVEPLHTAIGLAFFAVLKLAHAGRPMSNAELEDYLNGVGTMILADTQWRLVSVMALSFVGEDRPNDNGSLEKYVRGLLQG